MWPLLPSAFLLHIHGPNPLSSIPEGTCGPQLLLEPHVTQTGAAPPTAHICNVRVPVGVLCDGKTLEYFKIKIW